MRTLTCTLSLVAAVITRFQGSIMHTDDGDRIDLGHAFLGQNNPTEGDYIVRTDDGEYRIRSAASMSAWRREEEPVIAEVAPPKKTRKKKVADPSTS
jgi:hypothetical protein